MSDIMLRGVLLMPYEMAMANELSRLQYWQRGQQAADEIERLRELLEAAEEDIERKREHIKFYRDENATQLATIKRLLENEKWLLEDIAALKGNAEPVGWYDSRGVVEWSASALYGLTSKQPLYTSPAIPEGWVMVPKEPTKEQVAMGWREEWAPVSIYRAMIAAAPKPNQAMTNNICGVCGIDMRQEACKGSPFNCPQS